MTFQIPESLDHFSVSGLEDLLHRARTEYDTLIASASAESMTDEEIDDLEDLQSFVRVTLPGAIKHRKGGKDRQARLDALSADSGEPEEPETEEEPEKAPEAITASQGDGESNSRIRVSDIAATSTGTEVVPLSSRPMYSTLVAAAGVPNFEAGQPLATMLDVAKAFEARTAGHAALTRAGGGKGSEPIMYPVAQLVRDYPDEFSVFGDEGDYAKLEKVRDEFRLPGGSLMRSVELRREQIEKEQPGRDALVAAQGWCAPSETDYDICLQITTDGLLDAPEVQARRGGVRHNTGLEFDTIFGVAGCAGGVGPTGYFNLTEAQVAAGTTKTCLEIPCPEFVDDRLGVTGLCLTGNILATRGYPEFTAAFTRGALAASAHQINREQIAAIVTGSTPVNLSGAPWATDGSTVSQVMSAVEMAVVDIKYRLRLQRSATLEVLLPYWIGAQMRADWIRRNGGDYDKTLTLADSAISSAFAARGARPQYLYDWQDAFSNCAASGTAPGADSPISNLPTSLTFVVYPAGTWVRAVNDVITLNSVYDSTKLATNQVTHLFTETGWKMLKMCPVSRAYTVAICPSGKTTNQGTLTCP